MCTNIKREGEGIEFGKVVRSERTTHSLNSFIRLKSNKNRNNRELKITRKHDVIKFWSVLASQKKRISSDFVPTSPLQRNDSNPPSYHGWSLTSSVMRGRCSTLSIPHLFLLMTFCPRLTQIWPPFGPYLVIDVIPSTALLSIILLLNVMVTMLLINVHFYFRPTSDCACLENVSL